MQENKKASRRNNEMDTEFEVGFVADKTGTYRIEINDDISSPAQFSSAILALEHASSDDAVVIYLQCNGGALGATDSFIHALRKCEARVHIIATGLNASAATLIAMEADSMECSANSHFLVHCGSSGAMGNANEYYIQSKFDNNFWPTQFRSWYEGLLTSKEIDEMLIGKDIWFSGEEFMDRMNLRNQFYKDKLEAMTAPAKKTRKKAVKTEAV